MPNRNPPPPRRRSDYPIDVWVDMKHAAGHSRITGRQFLNMMELPVPAKPGQVMEQAGISRNAAKDWIRQWREQNDG